MVAQQQADMQSGAPRWGRRLRAASRTRKIVYGGATLVVVAVLALVLSLAAGPGKQAPRVLPLARSFSLTQLGHAGSRISLASYAGRPVIVNFFASWCSPCQRETPMLAKFYDSQHGKVILLGIDSNDEAPAALRFLHKAGVSYPVGFDPYPASTTTSYGVYALPQTFFLNAQHRIVLHILGPVTMKDLTRGVALMDSRRPAADQNRG